MKRSKVSEAKIFSLLREGETGVSIDDICRKYEVSRSAYYKFRSQYGGMELSDLKKLRHLEEENNRLKHMYADLSLDYKVLKDVIEKKFQGQLSEEKR
jgi:putative transposase